jgi:hypothetical protein
MRHLTMHEISRSYCEAKNLGGNPLSIRYAVILIWDLDYHIINGCIVSTLDSTSLLFSGENARGIEA